MELLIKRSLISATRTGRRVVTNRSLRLQALRRPKTPPIETARRDLCHLKTPCARHREGTWRFDRYAPHRESGASLPQDAAAGLAFNRAASGVFAQERVRALPRLGESRHMRSALARRVRKRAPIGLKRGQRWAIREASTAPQQTRVCPHPRRAPVSTDSLYRPFAIAVSPDDPTVTRRRDKKRHSPDLWCGQASEFMALEAMQRPRRR